jgi:tetratricopeptide (TPR) repeat protein
MKKLILLSLVMSFSALAGPNEDKCNQLTVQGRALIKENKMTEAGPVLEQAVEVCDKSDVKDIVAYIDLVQYYFTVKKYPESIAVSKRALVKAPGLQITYMNLCAAEMQMNNFDAAIAACKSGLESKNPKNRPN